MRESVVKQDYISLGIPVGIALCVMLTFDLRIGRLIIFDNTSRGSTVYQPIP